MANVSATSGGQIRPASIDPSSPGYAQYISEMAKIASTPAGSQLGSQGTGKIYTPGFEDGTWIDSATNTPMPAGFQPKPEEQGFMTRDGQSILNSDPNAQAIWQQQADTNPNNKTDGFMGFAKEALTSPGAMGFAALATGGALGAFGSAASVGGAAADTSLGIAGSTTAFDPVAGTAAGIGEGATGGVAAGAGGAAAGAGGVGSAPSWYTPEVAAGTAPGMTPGLDAGAGAGATGGAGAGAGGAAASGVGSQFMSALGANPITTALQALTGIAGIATGVAGIKNANTTAGTGAGAGSGTGTGPGSAAATADPWAPYRQTYIDKLNDIMAHPEKTASLPGYQFQLGQGEQAIAANNAGKGTSNTPSGDIAVQQYGQSTAMSAYDNYVNQLIGLSGAGQNPAAGSAAALAAQNNALNAQKTADQQKQAGYTGIAQGVGALSTAFGGTTATPGSNSNTPSVVNNTYNTSSAPAGYTNPDTNNYLSGYAQQTGVGGP
jgi:hypothetical protein